MNNTLALNLPRLNTIKLNFSLKIFWILIFFIMLSLLTVCIVQLNAYTEEIYLIQDYEKKLSQLSQENRLLEIDFSKVNSLNNIGSYVQNQIFEKAERVEYIQVLEGTVVAKPK